MLEQRLIEGTIKAVGFSQSQLVYTLKGNQNLLHGSQFLGNPSEFSHLV